MSATLIIYPLNSANEEVAYILDCNDIDISLTLTIQDTQDVTKRRGSFSQTIELAGTNANNLAFGHAYNIQSFVGGFTANKRIRCLLWDNGIQVFNGAMQMLSISKEAGKVNYEVGIYSEEVAFFKQIAETQLMQTLGVSGFNHTLTAALASSTFIAAKGVGYVYGLIDGFGYSDTFPNIFNAWFRALLVPFNTITPSFYVKQIVDLIFAQAGYRYQSAFFESARFKSLVLPYAGGATIQNSLTAFNSRMSSDGFVQESDWIATSDPKLFYARIAIDTLITDPNGYWNTATNIFTNDNGYAAFETSFVVEVVNGAGDNARIFFDWVDTVTGALVFVGRPRYLQMPANTTQKFTVYQNIRLAPNQTIELRIYAEFPTASPTNLLTTTALAEITMICTENPYGNLAVNMVTALPTDVTQADLLSDLQKMFNLYFYVTPQDPNLIYIEPFNDFYSQPAADWSSKVAQLGRHEITLGDVNANKSVTFKYGENNDALGILYTASFKEGYASRIYLSDNFNATGEQVVQTKAATIIPASYNSGLIIGRTFATDNNGLAKAKPAGYRIAQFNNIAIPNDSPWVLLTSDTPTFQSFTDLPHISHIDNPYDPTFDLAFGMPKQLYYTAIELGALVNYTNANLFNTYWSTYITETTSKEAMQIELPVILTPADIAILDFRRPIYVDGILFRLIEIRGYSPSQTQPCTVLLRRILNLTQPATGDVAVLTFYDSNDRVLGETKPQMQLPTQFIP